MIEQGVDEAPGTVPIAPSGHRRPLSAHVFSRIAGVSTISVVILASILAWLDLRDTQRELIERRAGRASIVASAIDGFLTGHERAVSLVADLSPADSEGRQRAIDTLRVTHPDILTALVADAGGAIVAASPAPPQGSPAIVGQSVADRDYFRETMKSGASFVSGAFLGRGFGSDPIVAIAAPLRGGGPTPDGIVEASINLRRLESFKSLTRGLKDTALVVADPAGMVVFSTLGDFPALSDLSARTDLRIAAGNPEEVDFVDAGRRAWSVASARSNRGWRVYVLQDTVVARQKIRQQIAVTALLVALLAIVSFIAASAVATRITEPLERLAQSVRSMRGGEAAANVPLPHPNAPVEVAELFDDVREMAERVVASRLNLEQTNRQLEETLDLARAGSRTKTAFLAKMSHELRTPLNAVIGFSSILEQRLASDDKGLALARRAHAAGSGMLHMIEELLEIARVESGQTELSPSDASLAEITAEAVRAAGDAHPGAVDRIALVSADEQAVRVDTGHFVKAVSNVAAAALELTATVVRVTARLEPDEGCRWIVVHCTIREAVDRETLASLLDPFWQGETGTGAVKFGATRLGLALAHRYAEIMGGHLDVRTTADETLFAIRIPDESAERAIQPS